jgi:Holliday junction resolvase RusA-like endonuclease
MATAKRAPAVLPATFGVYGRPRTKGSLNVYCLKNARHTVRVEEETKDSSLWRRMVARAAQAHMLETSGGLWNVGDPVGVRLLFVFPAWIGVGGEVVPSHDTPWPTAITLGDIDKLTRNVLDALTDAHMIEDDRLVVQLQVAKEWADELRPAGVSIQLREPAPRDAWWSP